MGGLGQKMSRRALVKGAICGAALILCACIGAQAGGVWFGALAYTVDLAATFGKVPIAANEAFDALDRGMIDYGVPPQDRAEVRHGFEDGLAAVEEALGDAPTLLPVPLLGGSLEIGLPLLLLNGVRFSAGFLSDGLVREIADLAGLPIPSPLVDVEIDEDGFDGSLAIDFAFGTWAIVTEVTKRFDLFVVGLDLAAGVLLVGGGASPEVEVDVPTELAEPVQAALAALRLDELTWSAFAITSAVGVEIGPPFLRLVGEVRFILPISASSGWWDVRIGGIGGSVGMVIRF